jgi:hypothetical protein
MKELIFISVLIWTIAITLIFADWIDNVNF